MMWIKPEALFVLVRLIHLIRTIRENRQHSH